MRCINPYYNDAANARYGCGQCIPCLINRRRGWTARLWLESLFFDRVAFVTLTYNNANFPEGGDLVKKDLQLFFKRLRKVYFPDRNIRYFACGEYGEDFGRPHYHAIIYDLSRYDKLEIMKAWGKGFVTVDNAPIQAFGYVAGYITKKYTKIDPRQAERVPEFQIMSKGLGYKALPYLKSLAHKLPDAYLKGNVDKVVSEIRIGGKLWPIPYPLQKIMKEALYDEETLEYAKLRRRARASIKEYLADWKALEKAGYKLVDKSKFFNKRKGL